MAVKVRDRGLGIAVWFKVGDVVRGGMIAAGVGF